jgi:hypothetical protein
MKSFNYLLICLFFVSSCAPWKDVLVAEGDRDDAIQNAIYDFLQSSKLSKEDSVFNISTQDYNEQLLAISIYGSTNKLLISTEDSVKYDYSGLAIDYKEMDGKLFYWYDSTKEVTTEIINTLTKYNMIDTTILNVYIPPRHIEHSKKGVDYYFCKNNLLKYKKVKTNKVLGYYDPPNLNCK